jgi:O-acetyl-ADP-ribose deacetylase (regulator of RNase III)
VVVHARPFGSGSIELVQADITLEPLDAIVNAANSSLLGGGGVDGAIHRAGGPAILEECRRLRARSYPDGLPPGKAVATGAGRLPCRVVIHTVGPVWHGGASGEAETLASCYRTSLALCDEQGLRSVAFPSISTGAYGYPVARAAEIALGSVREVLLAGSSVALIRFCLFSAADLESYRGALNALPAA